MQLGVLEEACVSTHTHKQIYQVKISTHVAVYAAVIKFFLF